MINGAFELAGILTVKLNPYLIKKLGKKKAILFSYILLVFFPLVMGSLDFCDPHGKKTIMNQLLIGKYFLGFHIFLDLCKVLLTRW